MVDISGKDDSRRVAVAEGVVRLAPATVELIRSHGLAKGDVLVVARVAGILAAKQTPALIPMCHPILLTDVQIELELQDQAVLIEARVSTVGKTGAEMEALTAVAAAALTVYDMCKAVDREMVVEGVRVRAKTGGKSDWSQAAPSPQEPVDREAG